MNKASLLIGGNLGDRQGNFQKAKELINQYCGRIVRSSSLYETAAWGKTDQPSFLNQAVEIETSLGAQELMQKILEVEKLMGRQRNERYGPRIIDIDILLFNDEQYDEPFLKIPHPELQNRRFALTPLAEISPNLRHPTLKKPIAELLEQCTDQSSVKKYQ